MDAYSWVCIKHAPFFLHPILIIIHMLPMLSKDVD